MITRRPNQVKRFLGTNLRARARANSNSSANSKLKRPPVRPVGKFKIQV